MRILTLTSSYPLAPDDGRGSFVRDLSLALMQQGFDVRVAAPRPADREIPDDPSGPDVGWLPTLISADTRVFHGSGIEANLRAHPSLAFRMPRFLASFSLEALMAAWQSDVIVAHWLLPMGLVGALVSRVTGRPLIVVDHSGPAALSQMPPLRSVLRFVVASASVVACVSNDVRTRTAKRVGTRLAHRLTTLPLGIDLRPAAEPPLVPGTLRILFAGRLVPIKGVDVLIRALAKTRGLSLTVIGDGPEGPRLRDLAGQLEVPATFLGELDREATRQAMQRHDILVVPSRHGRLGRREGLPRVLQEAWACGLPVIASRTGGLEEALLEHHGGQLVAPGDVVAWRRAMQDCAADQVLRRRWRNEALEAAACLSWAVVGPRWAALVNEAARRAL